MPSQSLTNTATVTSPLGSDGMPDFNVDDDDDCEDEDEDEDAVLDHDQIWTPSPSQAEMPDKWTTDPVLLAKRLGRAAHAADAAEDSWMVFPSGKKMFIPSRPSSTELSQKTQQVVDAPRANNMPSRGAGGRRGSPYGEGRQAAACGTGHVLACRKAVGRGRPIWRG